jgi:hypothetical protein
MQRLANLEPAATGIHATLTLSGIILRAVHVRHMKCTALHMTASQPLECITVRSIGAAVLLVAKVECQLRSLVSRLQVHNFEHHYVLSGQGDSGGMPGNLRLLQKYNSILTDKNLG